MRVLLFTEWRGIITELTDIIFFHLLLKLMCHKEIVKDYCFIIEIFDKGPVKLIKRVKIAHSFSQSVSN